MKYRFITIEREYASGGRAVAEQVAEQLGIPCYGNELLLMAAERKGVSPALLAKHEERANNSFLYSLFLLGQVTAGKGDLTQKDELMVLESTIIWEIAAKEQPCVFVGRAAHSVLKDRRDVLSVFIFSDPEERKRRAVESYGAPPAEAAERLREIDRRRANYYKSYTGETWDDRTHYHLLLNSGKLGLEGCVKNIIAVVE